MTRSEDVNFQVFCMPSIYWLDIIRKCWRVLNDKVWVDVYFRLVFSLLSLSKNLTENRPLSLVPKIDLHRNDANIRFSPSLICFRIQKQKTPVATSAQLPTTWENQTLISRLISKVSFRL